MLTDDNVTLMRRWLKEFNGDDQILLKDFDQAGIGIRDLAKAVLDCHDAATIAIDERDRLLAENDEASKALQLAARLLGEQKEDRRALVLDALLAGIGYAREEWEAYRDDLLYDDVDGYASPSVMKWAEEWAAGRGIE